MVGVSILPVAIHKNKLYFLFGKEKALENGIRGFSDFGGGKEDESIFEGAIREGCEELTGFLGTKKTLKDRIKKAGGTYQINFDDKYYSHIFLMDYDEKLPLYYNNNHDFLWEKMNNKHLSQTKFFEKMKIEPLPPIPKVQNYSILDIVCIIIFSLLFLFNVATVVLIKAWKSF